jgi:methyl-accepting chemotaxis protein
MNRVMAEITKGNFGARAKFGASETEGETLKSFNTMLEIVLIPFRLSNDYFDRIANGDEMSQIEENYAGDLGVLKEKINRCAETLASVTQAAGSLSDGISKGILHTRAKVEGLGGRWGEMFEKVNSVAETLVNPLEEIEKVMERLANNDFSIRVKGEYPGEYGRIKNSINAGIDNMTKLMVKLRENADQLSAMSEQVSKFMEKSDLADSAKEAKPQVESVKYVPDDQVISDMNHYSEEIEKIVTIIDEIAAQISLLALNAAIESAAARDNGNGFAAIAEDIRKLAERTTEADRRLSELIRNAHSGIQQAIAVLAERVQITKEEREG